MDLFKDIKQAPADSIFGINEAFIKDGRLQKLNASVGTYRDEKLQPYILPSVKIAEQALINQEVSKEYLPIGGDAEYLALTKQMIFGSETLPHIAALQTLGGTGALRLAGELITQLIDRRSLYLAEPTWGNHVAIFSKAGCHLTRFPHLADPVEQMQGMQKNSAVLLQASCHNPTGMDPTPQQWKQIADIAKQKELFVIFDLAYQGFGEGLKEDVRSIEVFMHHNLPFAVAVSYSKNFGLYAERTGALFVVCHDEKQANAVASQLKLHIRANYSNPPCHGSRIVKYILQSTSLRRQWEEELCQMRNRILQMRQYLVQEVAKMGSQTQNDYQHIGGQKGMFAYPTLQPAQVQKLKEEYGIYLTADGRINLAGLNKQAVCYLASALVELHKS